MHTQRTLSGSVALSATTNTANAVLERAARMELAGTILELMNEDGSEDIQQAVAEALNQYLVALHTRLQDSNLGPLPKV